MREKEYIPRLEYVSDELHGKDHYRCPLCKSVHEGREFRHPIGYADGICICPNCKEFLKFNI